jgi:D-tyrosyl-tRNA(Tyr) deacylase
VAVQAEDSQTQIERCCERILNYRIFVDQEGKMNKSLRDIETGLLIVPQFTLLADTNKGNRPSFSHNVLVEFGQQRFEQLIEYAQNHYHFVQQGHFGADMQVSLTNDGPATFWLEV